MKITLELEGKEKTFVAPRIKARAFRNSLDLSNRLDFSNLSVEDLDELAGFVCEVFGNQFSFDEFWDGLPNEELNEKILEVLDTVTAGKTRVVETGNEQGK